MTAIFLEKHLAFQIKKPTIKRFLIILIVAL